ncbi:decarboxylating cobalt-precorrin-6B (C(15))-methyltransferase [Enterococcus sp. AZ109]|uniref:decarboxylating cobalt-precorrin-6B (C(15))-methyltransferase n=1 Tax=Enterococcus sp. AZ109 TaxID=2774634 RepID=UPI003F253010
MKDSSFIRGAVPMTKEEIRSVSLAKLQLRSAQNFLDVGTGTGSIAIEAAYTYPQLEVTTLDSNPDALELLKQNQAKFELSNVKGILAKAPVVLDQQFDAIFIGGSGGNLTDILEWSFRLLTDKGRLVLNFILLENALAAIQWLEEQEYFFQAVQLQVGQYTKLGKGHYYKPQNPVIIIETGKGE